MKYLSKIIETEVRKKRPASKLIIINFVKEDQLLANKATYKKAMLDEAKEWEVLVDLKKKLVFPSVFETTPRPDIMISSEKSKDV